MILDLKKYSAIIQARMGSGRLPGKILTPISGAPLLWHIVERLKRVRGLQNIVVATTVRIEDNAVEDFCDNNEISCYRGDSENVLKRFIETAEKFNIEHFARVCGDNPLFDIPFMEEMMKEHLKAGADITYTLPEVPLGSAGEVVSLQPLKRSYKEAQGEKFFEHVTPYLRENTNCFKNLVLEPPDYMARGAARLTVDTVEDLELIRKIYACLYKKGSVIDLNDALDLLEANPGWLEINSMVRQRAWNE